MVCMCFSLFSVCMFGCLLFFVFHSALNLDIIVGTGSWLFEMMFICFILILSQSIDVTINMFDLIDTI